MTGQKSVPAPIRTAQEALALLRAENATEADNLRGLLPGYALWMAKKKKELTPETLLAHARLGAEHLRAPFREKKKRRKSYASIVKKLNAFSYEGLDKYERIAQALKNGDLPVLRDYYRRNPSMLERELTAVSHAINARNPKLLEWLRRQGKDITPAAMVWDRCVQNGNLPMVRYLFEKLRPLIPPQNPNHNNPLRPTGLWASVEVAVAHCQSHVLKYLLDNGAKPETRQQEAAVLRSAIRFPEIFRLLYKYGHVPAPEDMKDLVESPWCGSAGFFGSLAWLELQTPSNGPRDHLAPGDQKALDQMCANMRLWQRTVKCESLPYLASHTQPPQSFEKKTFNFVLRALNDEGYIESTAHAMAYKTAIFFGTKERVLQYLEKWGKPGKQPLHDLVYMLSYPRDACSANSLKDWSDAILQCGPSMAELTKFMDKIPSPARGADGKAWSAQNTRALAVRFAFNRAAEHLQLATLCMEHAVDEEAFNKALDIVQKGPPAPKLLPDIRIEGEKFGMPGAVFRRLPEGDIRALFFGEMVNCCQSIGGHAEEAAEHSYASKHGALYVVEDQKGRIISGAWAWLSAEGVMCFDSIETLGGRVTPLQWEEILDATGRELSRLQQQGTSETPVKAFTIGLGGGTPKMDFLEVAAPCRPKDASPCDSSKQALVWRSAANSAAEGAATILPEDTLLRPRPRVIR
jgi:hypothetical protein